MLHVNGASVLLGSSLGVTGRVNEGSVHNPFSPKLRGFYCVILHNVLILRHAQYLLQQHICTFPNYAPPHVMCYGHHQILFTKYMTQINSSTKPQLTHMENRLEVAKGEGRGGVDASLGSADAS